MTTAHWASRLLYVTAQLNLADHLAEGPKTAEMLSELTGAHASSLYRVMRALAHLGVLTQDGQRCFTLTPLGQTLRTGAPGAARATVLTLAGDLVWRGFEHLFDAVYTGNSAIEKAFGEPVFDLLAKRPEEASLLSETMIGFHGEEPAAVAQAYDFSPFQTVVDIGGASGHLLTTVLSRHQEPRGILFDLPHVVQEAPAVIEARGLEDRVTVAPGNFFERVPSGGDAYLLSHIIHDWSEDLCLRILGNCRRAMKADGRLLIVEMVLPEGDAPHPGKLLDILMLVATGGQERTEPEYRRLLEKAGFRLERVVPTGSAVSVVVAAKN